MGRAMNQPHRWLLNDKLAVEDGHSPSPDDEINKKAVDNATSIVTDFNGMTIDPNVSVTLQEFAENKPYLLSMTGDMILDIIKASKNILIVDEINAILSEKDSNYAYHAYQAVVRETKQERKMSAVWLASNQTFLNMLMRAGCNLTHVTDFIIVGEPSPQDVYKLLTEEWGVGPNLTIALIDVLGGDVYSISKVLEMIVDTSHTDDSAVNTIFIAPKNNINKVVSTEKSDKYSQHELHKVSAAVASKGYYLVETREDDAIAELLVKHNVCSAVMPGMFAEHIPTWLKDKEEVILVPNLQLMRMVIASALTKRNL